MIFLLLIIRAFRPGKEKRKEGKKVKKAAVLRFLSERKKRLPARQNRNRDQT